jgi:hypothetical protein
MAIYRQAFSDGSGDLRAGAVKELSVPEMKAWLSSGDTKKPLAYTNPPTDRRPKGPLSLFQFLAKNGGIREYGGELAAMGLDRSFVPGFGRLVRPGGMPLDRAREAAVEAGYLHDAGALSGGPSESLVNDLLDALDAEARGDRVYSMRDIEAVQARHAQQQEKASAEALKRAVEDVRALAKGEGINATDQEIQDAAQFALVNNADLIDALVEIVERSYYAVHDEVVALEPQEQGHGQPAANVTGRSDQGGAGQPPPRQQPAGAQAEPAAGTAPDREQSGEAERARGAPSPVEPTPDYRDPAYPKKLRQQQHERMEGEPSVTRDSAPTSVPSNEAEKISAPPKSGRSDGRDPIVDLANSLLGLIKSRRRITSKDLQEAATRAYGSTLAQGRFDRKDMQDALELAVNMHILENREMHILSDGNWKGALTRLDEMLSRLPTQRVRSEEQESFQQFSTPPNYSAAAAYVANLREGDTVLEPSAGTGSLVAAASRPGVEVIANEISDRRAALLRRLMGEGARIFKEDAEQINNILDVKPTVVVMNPPFSRAGNRLGDKKDPMTAARHIEQGLKLLAPGGRLVAIVGRGMTMGQPSYRAWWDKISKEYAVRANIGVDGKVYEKYGTTFGTRLLVIDKVAPTGAKPVLADAQTVEDLMRALEPIRNGRPNAELQERGEAERVPAEPDRAGVAEGSGRGRAGALPAPAQSGDVGAGERRGRGVAGTRDSGTQATGGSPVRVEDAQLPLLASEQSERPGNDRTARQSEKRAGERGQPEGSRGERVERDLEPAGGRQSGAETGSVRVELEHHAPGTQAATDTISESLYEPYRAHTRVKGAKSHPGPLVQSAAMASVEPPAITYKPHLPRAVIADGLLSEAQIEIVASAGQAHERMLPSDGDEPARRQGYFIGDGTGVGKGREIAGIILDNWTQGRTKAVWVSEKKTLRQDARRDWKGLGQNPDVIFDVGKVTPGDPVSATKGIGFITYDTLKGGMSDQAALARGGFVRGQRVSIDGQPGKVQRVGKGRAGEQPDIVVVLDSGGPPVTVKPDKIKAEGEAVVKSRVDQIVQWVGEDFDGVIAFDESHNMGNATGGKTERGAKDAAQKALAGMELQRRLPNARVVYVSATGATEVSNLAYADRLGLWGRGTAFASREKFVSEMEEGGIAAMELIARDLKQLGLYQARNLSFDGVEYERLEHTLDANQRDIYDTLAESWQVVLQNINDALEATGGERDGRAKAAAYSAFWGAHQRFFNQIVTSMQMPSVVKDVEKELAKGHQVVFQLTNTNEASQERAAAKATSAEEIEDLDITPRDQIIQLVETSFPTQQYETYVDDDGKKRSRPVKDRDGKPVQNKEALALRERLIDRLTAIRVPQGPLDLLLDHFGADTIAEVTGRGRRFVLKKDTETGDMRRREENRPASANIAESDAFQAGKKKGLVFSEAGGTGRSYHADNTAPSKDARRVHYLIQGGWRADKAVQGFGRTHRTNQASAPVFKLVTTDLKGQKRFISSIARRLAQLGALTKGQRQAGDQGLFSARDNLESREASHALALFFNDLIAGRVKGIELNDFQEQTGLKLQNEDEDGRVTRKQEMPPITQFLNRLLSLKIDMQNKVFDAFAERLDGVIEAREQAGLLDMGLETVRADKIEKVSEQVVHVEKESGAQTKHVVFKMSDKFVPVSFDKVANSATRPVLRWTTSPNGKVYAVAEGPNDTDAKTGAIVPYYRLMSPVSDSRVVKRDNLDKDESQWTEIGKAEAEKLWQKEIDAAPEFVTRDMHLITGTVLPIWDKLKGEPRVVRLQTDDRQRFLGRVVPSGKINATLAALGAAPEASKLTPKDLFTRLMGGARARLSNGWTLKRALVAGEHRIELIGPASLSEGNQVKSDGVFTERIEYRTRYFVPTDEKIGAEAIGKLTKHRTVSELTEPAGRAAGDVGFAEGGGSSRDTFTDLGPFALKRDLARGEQAQAYVLERGRDTGREHLIAYDKNGKVIAHAIGTENRLGLSPELAAAMKDPAQAVVIHHNHPTDSSLSRLDIAMLANPGLHAVWAHGHKGTVARAQLTERARKTLAPMASPGNVQRLYEIAKKIGNIIYDPIQREVLFGRVNAAAAQFLDAHLVAEIMQRAGIIEYRSNIDLSATIEKLKLEDTIKKAADIAAGSMFDNGKAENAGDGRRAEPLRHLGDVGASFGRSEDAAGGRGAQATDDQDRRGNDRQKTEESAGAGLASDDGNLFKTEVVSTPDGPREQFVIPGAEKAGTRAQLERKGAEPKRSSKPQKTVDGLPLFKGEPDPDLPIFELKEEPTTYKERHQAMQGFLARGQFIDRAIRMPFDIFGGTTRDGTWKPGVKLFDKASKVIVRAEFSPESRFAFLNPVLETARTGLVDRYGLRDMPEYVDRERARALDERAVMLQGAEILKSLKDHGVGREEAKVLQAILTGEAVAEGDMGKLAEPIRAAIDQLGQEAVALGLLSAESYERNRGAYLHRVYQKYESEQSGLNRLVNRIMGSRRKKIIGDQFRGRGLFQEIDVPRLMKDVPGWAQAARGKPQKGEAFILLDELPGQGELALNDDTSKVKPLRRVYWPAEKAIPDKYDGFRNQGMWEVRAVDGGKVTLWRDFTKEERLKMGEILDARYTIGKTFMLMAHDLANGKFYKDIAENEAWTRSLTPNATWVDASEWSAQARRYKGKGEIEWVKVPDAEIPNSGGKKRWGALAGKWVREEIWRDLNELQIMQRPNLWRALLTQWKLNKTARSPVVHMNNVMSNFVLMDMIDVRFQDFAAGIRSYLKQDAAYQEAFENGAFGADMMTQEVRDQVLKPILEELERDNTYKQGGPLGALGQVSKFTESLWSKLKALDQKMIDAYRVEDELFRMATYMRRRQLGDDPKQAAEVAREQFVDYDVRAPWVNTARNTVLPFISYTYRAVPMVARAIATRPWKLGKYFLLAYLLNALAYWATGDDDETPEQRAKREERERKSLRENEQGTAWIGTPRMLRLPANDRYGNPLFLDMRRWVPASDVFDTQGNDIPAWANLGGPLMIAAELYYNRNAFTGEEIVNTKTDDVWDRMWKRGEHLYKSWVPSAAWIPGSWYWTKIENAVKGATDSQGRPYNVGLALSNSVGVKIKPQDVEDARRWQAYEFRKVEQELATEMRRLGRRHQRKMISDAEFERAKSRLADKRKRLQEKRRETLD